MRHNITNHFFILPIDKKFLPIKYADTSYKYKGYYVLNTNDTLFYNVFYYLNSLSEECPELEQVSNLIKTEVVGKDTINTWSGYTNYDRDINRRQNVYYRDAKNFRCKYKITVPIDSNKGGLFGVYVDSFFKYHINFMKMNVYVENPQKGCYKELYKSFFSILLIPHDSNKFKLPEPYPTY